MKLRWHNIGILFLAIFLGSVLLRHGREIGGVVDHIEHIGPGHSPDEQTLGLLSLGIICVTIVAVIRLLTNRRPPGPRPPGQEESDN
jgi:hypothetical protein